jgi:hypothetical protein
MAVIGETPRGLDSKSQGAVEISDWSFQSRCKSFISSFYVDNSATRRIISSNFLVKRHRVCVCEQTSLKKISRGSWIATEETR